VTQPTGEPKWKVVSDDYRELDLADALEEVFGEGQVIIIESSMSDEQMFEAFNEAFLRSLPTDALPTN
jgi:hypothetical protein